MYINPSYKTTVAQFLGGLKKRKKEGFRCIPLLKNRPKCHLVPATNPFIKRVNKTEQEKWKTGISKADKTGPWNFAFQDVPVFCCTSRPTLISPGCLFQLHAYLPMCVLPSFLSPDVRSLQKIKLCGFVCFGNCKGILPVTGPNAAFLIHPTASPLPPLFFFF